MCAESVPNRGRAGLGETGGCIVPQMARSEPVERGNLPASAADCHQVHGSARSGGNLPGARALCHFEQVRGRGEAEVVRLATRQHGHIHRQQVMRAGLGRGAIAHRLQTGWLQEVHPSVYRLAGVERSRAGRCMAAALVFAGHAVVSERDAASLWQLLDTTQEPREDAPVHVLLAGRSFRPRPAILVRRVVDLPQSDVRWRRGIPVTSPARTLLDLAGTLSDLELQAALAAAWRRSLTGRPQLDEVMARNPRARGIGMLRALLAQDEPLHDTRSTYERRMLALLEAAELPRPLTNVLVADKLVDGLWPDLKLAYEFDGWRFHRDRFERDRLRDQDLLIAGHRVMRISRRQIDLQPYALVARIASVITTLRLGG